jgi:cytochrome c peroxidase
MMFGRNARAALIVGILAAAPTSLAAIDQVPLGLTPVPVPAANPLTDAKVALGKELFFEPGLSSNGTVSCASCHVPSLAFADRLPLSKGVKGYVGLRNAPTIFNVAYSPRLMWDGRALGLEDQSLYPLMHPREMSSTPQRAVEFIGSKPSYAGLFANAFGDPAVTWLRVAQSLASYQRTLLSGGSPFDRYMAGEQTAITEAAVRGFALFRGAAGCIDCHTYSREQPFFTDFQFNNNGLTWGPYPDLGRYEISKERVDKGAFRTPSLRDVARTAPYMHDGRMASLEEVIEFYNRGGDGNPFADRRIRPLHLSEQDKSDLVAFLNGLTGEHVGRPQDDKAAAR